MIKQLIDLDTKLTILANNPCACAVCAKAARFALLTLAEVTSSGTELLDTPLDSPQFAAAERKFQTEELARLQAAYDTISQVRCQMVPPPQLDTSWPAPDQGISKSAMELDAELYLERVEFYRKHRMKPRMVHRRARIEPKKNPRVPGSYVIKP